MVGELKSSEPWKAAVKVGLKVASADEVAKAADIVMMLVPDQLQKEVYNSSIEKNLKKGDMLICIPRAHVHRR